MSESTRTSTLYDKIQEERVKRVKKTINKYIVEQKIFDNISEKINHDDISEEGKKDLEEANKIFLEKVEENARGNPLLTFLTLATKQLSKELIDFWNETETRNKGIDEKLSAIETEVKTFTQNSEGFAQKLKDFELTSESLKRNLDQYPTIEFIKAIIGEELGKQSSSLKETLISKEALEKLEKKFDGGDSQGGLVGKLNQLDKKNDTNFNQLNNILTSHTNSLNNLDTAINGKDGLVGKLNQLDKKIEDQKLWQIAPLVAVFLGIVGFAFFVRTTTLDAVKVEFQDDFKTVNTELTNIKLTQKDDFNKINTELTNIKTTQQKILEKLEKLDE